MHGYGESDGLAWISMELVEGNWTLRDFLDDLSREEKVPPDYDRHVARFVTVAHAFRVDGPVKLLSESGDSLL